MCCCCCCLLCVYPSQQQQRWYLKSFSLPSLHSLYFSTYFRFHLLGKNENPLLCNINSSTAVCNGLPLLRASWRPRIFLRVFRHRKIINCWSADLSRLRRENKMNYKLTARGSRDKLTARGSRALTHDAAARSLLTYTTLLVVHTPLLS